ncbi:hypothetical protein PV336_34705 [Streptomyces sp. MI02-2A]|uniref:hypothetical protein n=1 Tax=Streptomyces sp. MI02-2A TaxID=3028688 RepID=UPI0029B21B91|nr:hypothetical protein [Streptomyces sp. MI02-2A]MDX3264298.1 hypothetical protein [Streptomyces sp. MI02-2A]
MPAPSGIVESASLNASIAYAASAPCTGYAEGVGCVMDAGCVECAYAEGAVGVLGTLRASPTGGAEYVAAPEAPASTASWRAVNWFQIWAD